MPITSTQVTIEYKLLPIVLKDDGGASVAVRKGLRYPDGTWELLNTLSYEMDPVVVSQVLDAEPVAGLTRRDDLSFAIYNYLVNINAITGNVS